MLLDIFLEPMGSSILMFGTRLFSMFKLVVQIGLTTICIIVHTWMQLSWATICTYINIFWNVMMWTISILSLPVRVLTALQRERLVAMHLHEMQTEIENLMWNRRELEERLQIAVKERRTVESMFAEIEDDLDKAIDKIELLEGEVQSLKDENHGLKEVEVGGIKEKCDIPQRFIKADDVEQCRGVAVSQSLFSAILSLLVGMIIWEAQDPCMPLVIALFTVVAISLKSVVQFFYTIKNKPASDAVALLSINWFLLGTLTYPTLPRLTPLIAPMLFRLVDRLATSLRLSSY